MDEDVDIPKKHKRPEHKMYMEHHEHRKHTGYKAAAWLFGIIALLLAIGLVLSLTVFKTAGIGGSAGALTQDQVKAKTLAYLATAVPGQQISIDSIKDEGDIYSMKLNVGGRIYDSYARKDGSLLFPSAMDMNQKIDTTTAQPAENIPKADKPVVELFVMSHCPYGTQAEKGILPAINALGSKVDFQVKFVYYSMHGEKEVKEELTQYCIRTDQPTKYLKYLACFLNDSAGQGSATASDACIASLGIDKTKLDSCKTAADKQFSVMANFNDKSTWLNGQFPLMNFDKADNDKYKIGGSPTLVINGVQSSAGRDSASYLTAICNAMNTKAPECDTQLSSTTPGSGFGYDSTAAASAAGCGV
jgi:hypothetical protein